MISQTFPDRFLSTVRKRTRSLHDDLEQIMSADMVDPDLVVYQAWMAKLYAVWRPMEQVLRESSVVRDQDYLKVFLRADKLRQDLDYLSGGTFEPASLDYADFSGIGSSRAAHCGMTYVWTGSIHGAQVLAVRLREQLNLTAETGAGFFMLENIKDCRTNAMRFFGWLDESLTGQDLEAAVASAEQVYSIFMDHYARAHHGC